MPLTRAEPLTFFRSPSTLSVGSLAIRGELARELARDVAREEPLEAPVGRGEAARDAIELRGDEAREDAFDVTPDELPEDGAL